MTDRDAIIAAIATPQRAVRDISGLIGDHIAFGPVPAGPGGMATARAVGVVGPMRARQQGSTRTELHVPVQLDLTVDIGARAVPVEADMTVRIGLEACLAPEADHIVVEVDEIGPADIALETRTSGIGGVLVRRLGNLDAEIRHHVIAYVTEILDSPEARDLRRIDLDEASDTA